MKKSIFLALLFILAFRAFPQKNDIFIKVEDSLKRLGKVILTGENDFVKYNANEKFLTLLENTLIEENSFNYPFDSLVTIARLVAPDNKFRLFNWHIKKTDNTYEYFGVLQVWSGKQKKYLIFRLTDNSATIIKPETQALDCQYWYGAHYYKIIYTKSRGKKYYTLLGWDGNDMLTQKKIIDVLTFNANDKPIFGASIFKYNKKTQKRVIFEYSATTMMSLKYDKQYISYKKKQRRMIVFDRLAPSDKKLEGQYQFYFPETNIFDAFVFRAGKWVMVKDIDARMEKMSKEEKAKVKQIIREQKKHLRK